MPPHRFAKPSNASVREPVAADLTNDALGDTEFARLIGTLGPFEAHPRLAIAISGGADSLCLCLLCQRWCRSIGGSVQALLVDHGLREGAILEAALVAKWMVRDNIPFEMLRWQGRKPKTGLQARAREARYSLLQNRCRELGILHLVTGHHLDDQNETIEMRAARASGPRGMAGMAPIHELDHVRVVRPLLTIPKTRLIATMRAQGQAWIEDPSNRDPQFERTIVRRRHQQGETRSLQSAVEFARHRRQIDLDCARFFAAHSTPHPLGFVTIDPEAWPTAGLALQRLVLEKAIQAVSGSVFPVRSRKLDHLLEELSKKTQRPIRRTLGGTIVTLTDRRLAIIREHAAISDRVPLAADAAVMWDGRFELRHNGAENALIAEPATWMAIGRLAATTRKALQTSRVPTAALMALPQVRSRTQILAFLGPYRLDEAFSERLEIKTVTTQALAGAAFAIDTVA